MSLQTRFFVVFCLGVLSSYSCSLAVLDSTIADTLNIPWLILGFIGGWAGSRVSGGAS